MTSSSNGTYRVVTCVEHHDTDNNEAKKFKGNIFAYTPLLLLQAIVFTVHLIVDGHHKQKSAISVEPIDYLSRRYF